MKGEYEVFDLLVRVVEFVINCWYQGRKSRLSMHVSKRDTHIHCRVSQFCSEAGGVSANSRSLPLRSTDGLVGWW